MKFKIEMFNEYQESVSILREIIHFTDKFTYTNESCFGPNALIKIEGILYDSENDKEKFDEDLRTFERYVIQTIKYNKLSAKVTFEEIGKVDLWEHGAHINDVLEIAYKDKEEAPKTELINKTLEEYWNNVTDRLIKEDTLPF